jgi:hypothetical protein
MDSRQAHQVLAGLVDARVAAAEGERGGRVYRLADHLTSTIPTRPTEASRSQAEGQSFATGNEAGSSTTNHKNGPENANATHIANELRSGAKTVAELVTATGLTTRQVKYALQKLRDGNTVDMLGKRGHSDSRYQLRQA